MCKDTLPKFLLLILFCLGAVAVNAADLRVGLSADNAPMVFKQGDQTVGIEIDSIKALEGILGRKLKVIDMPFTRLLPALEAGEIDIIMSAMSVTQQRAKRVLFTDPYLKIGQMAIVHISKVGHFAQPSALYREGVRIGVQPGTTGAIFAEEHLTGAKISFFIDSPAAFAGLRKNEIDLYIHDATTSWLLATSKENSDMVSLNTPLTEEELAWAVRKGDVRFAEMVNDALERMKLNGTLRYILNRWIPVDVEIPGVSAQ